MAQKDRYHDAVNHTCDKTSLVKCLQTFAQKKAQYHNAVNDTRYLILFWEYPTETIKKARYHDAVYDTCHFILVWKIPHKWPKKLGTMMLCMTHVISFYYGKSHIIGPKKIGTMML